MTLRQRSCLHVSPCHNVSAYSRMPQTLIVHIVLVFCIYRAQCVATLSVSCQASSFYPFPIRASTRRRTRQHHSATSICTLELRKVDGLDGLVSCLHSMTANTSLVLYCIRVFAGEDEVNERTHGPSEQSSRPHGCPHAIRYAQKIMTCLSVHTRAVRNSLSAVRVKERQASR